MVLPLTLSGCQHAVWGNAMALCMTFGLFFGTLRLGRKPSDPRPPSSPSSKSPL
jgi:hypothetical protein